MNFEFNKPERMDNRFIVETIVQQLCDELDFEYYNLDKEGNPAVLRFQPLIIDEIGQKQRTGPAEEPVQNFRTMLLERLTTMYPDTQWEDAVQVETSIDGPVSIAVMLNRLNTP